jgi:phage tail sheath protein FI
MPVTPTYPGVYIEEIASGVHTIAGVATSIAAFVDFFPQGPVDEAVQILSPADFNRNFGGLDARSEASYAIQQFFLNGGSQCWVVRATSPTGGAKAATIIVEGGGTDILTITAASPGKWGNFLRVDIDYGSTDPAHLFNLTVTRVSTSGTPPQVLATEVFRNVGLDSSKPNYVAAVVNNASQLIRVAANAASPLPAATGATSKGFAAIGIPWSAGLAVTAGMWVIDSNGNLQVATNAGTSGGAAPSWSTVLGNLTNDGATVKWRLAKIVPANQALVIHANEVMQAAINGGAAFTPTITLSKPPVPVSFAWLAGLIQSQLRKVDPSLANAVVNVVGSPTTQQFLQIKPGTAAPSDSLAFTDTTGTLAATLGIDAASGNVNVQQYQLGSTTAKDSQKAGQAGDDGADPLSNPTGMTEGILGDPLTKTGIFALLDVDLFNILCLPVTMNLPDANAAQIAAEATKLAIDRRAFYVLDVPQLAASRDTLTSIQTWLAANATLRSPNAAVYFPRVDVADPLNDFRPRRLSPSGTIAGLYSRIDAARGVWKAPAGTEATLAGVQALEYTLTDPENGVLNPLAINCLRTFPVFGSVCWGARTLVGADQLESEWKYVPVRRFTLFLEESLYRGTKWVVFEPNDEPLWAQIRLNIGAFLQTLFRQGAFQGTSPQQAYFVKVDKETTTQTDIDNGIVNILVGFAPLKPAEFVIIQIQQMAGQTAV